MFGIGEAVERLRLEFPDVSISSLRFLEREGLLGPRRTAGGHRLFNEDDLDRVRLIKRHQAQHRSLAEIRELLARRDHIGSPDAIRDAFVAHIRAGRARDAEALIDEAGRVGLPYRTICFEILGPALEEIGDLWQRGEIDIAHEHLATAVTRDLLATLRAHQPTPTPTGNVAVAVCASGERHELGLRMVAGLLEQAGWTVHFLGADTPLESALRMAHDTHAHLIIVSVGELSHRGYLAALAQRLQDWPASHRPKLVVGGRAATEMSAGLTDQIDLVATSAERLLKWVSQTFGRVASPATA
ncbi:MAG: MerR family transcriptional regulator [Dehalococcoidia bacterium]|nr:MerR family transcriptional regulator [Dehalococcoidia bacterium]